MVMMMTMVVMMVVIVVSSVILATKLQSAHYDDEDDDDEMDDDDGEPPLKQPHQRSHLLHQKMVFCTSLRRRKPAAANYDLNQSILVLGEPSLNILVVGEPSLNIHPNQAACLASHLWILQLLILILILILLILILINTSGDQDLNPSAISFLGWFFWVLCIW